MFDISALHVWNCLEQAKNNEHPYGGDIAEVYAQHLAPSEPTEDQWKHAGKALYALLKQFCMINSVYASVDGRPIGDWMDDYKFFHKCDVRIFDEQTTEDGKRSTGKIQQDSDGHSESGTEKSAPPECTKDILSPVLLSGQSRQAFEELEDAARLRHEKRKQDNGS